MTGPDLEQIRAAAARIAPHVHRTPLARSRTLDERLGAEVVFKCENLQKVGAFKARGATNAVLSLDDEVAGRGVTTHSSGNHGAAVAYAARIRGIACVVVIPDDAPPVKVEAVRGYGAEVISCPRHQREETCRRLIEQRGMSFVHPFEDPRVIAGQGTVALELLDEAGDLDLVVAPVGGGGLLAGTAIAVKSLSPQTEVWGAEPEAADDAYRSLVAGKLLPAPENPATLADGMMTGLGRINFEILRERAVRVVRVSERAIVEASRFIVERMKLVVEPSGATSLAAVSTRAAAVAGRRIGVVISGGNTDFAWLREGRP